MSINLADRKLLHVLDKNSRAPYSQIARDLRLSKQTVKNRVERMLVDRTIYYLYTAVNLSNFGLMPVQVFVTLSSEEGKKELVQFLLQSPHVPQVAVCDGVYDVFFGLVAKTHADVSSQLDNLLKRFPSLVTQKEVVFFVETQLYPHDYLIGKKRDAVAVNRGFQPRLSDTIKVKDIDLTILQMVTQDTRRSAASMANELGVSAQTIINRIKSLEKQGVICGHTFVLNPHEIIQHQILLEFTAMDEGLQQSLYQFCSQHSNIIFASKMFGAFDFGIYTTCLDLNEYRVVVDKFKERFSSHIKRFVPLLITDFPKLNFNPEDR